ncbi:hypothetical protein HMI54_002762 [Coelomomyces lativittatus]|nr:hypothetical protein HMI54_002762 [Coelomomyces lativittatus]KAJ1516460.1 hypothetical protein HMI55_002201 [Coelomomyces lativittatus]
MGKILWEGFTKEFKAPVNMAFDGLKNAFAPAPFPKAEKEIPFTVPPSPNVPPKRRKPRNYTVTFKKVATIEMAELAQFLSGKVKISGKVLAAIQVMDVIFRHVPLLKHMAVARSFFSPDKILNQLRGGLDLWGGVFQSVRPGINLLSLNVDVAFTTFIRPMPLLDYICEVIRREKDEFRRPIPPPMMQAMERAVKGLIVRAQHRRDVQPPFRVTRLTRTACDETMFRQVKPGEDPSTGKDISVANYFKAQYNVSLQYPKLPCIVSDPRGGQGKSVSLPIELCIINPGQRNRGKLTDEQTSAIIRSAALKPLDRQRKIKELASALLDLEASNPTLNAFGIKMDSNFVALDARVLPAPKLEAADKRSAVPQGGTWQFRGLKFLNASRITSIGVINFAGGRSRFSLNDGDVRNAMNSFFRICEINGVLFNPTKNTRTAFPVIPANPNDPNLEGVLTNAYNQIGNAFKFTPECMIIVMPGRNSELYAECKRIADCVLGVPTQMVLAEKIKNANDMYWGNVALKLNVKGFGNEKAFQTDPTNFVLSTKPAYFQRPFMILGADVTHPPPFSNEPSIAGIVASADPHGARYLSSTRIQSSRQEDIVDLKGMMTELLNKFKEKSKTLPERILFYRDGVSEGQFEFVRNQEIKALKETFKEFQINPKLSFIVVQKRHHTRFFSTKPDDCDRSGNLKSGLVVDKVVCHPTDYDFFLQSQAGLQGTCSPSHYQVLEDEYGFKPDELQLLTYHLTFLYARCTRAVKVVPPAYYAHLLVFRARYRLKGPPEGSVASGRSGGGSEKEQANYVLEQMKPNMINSMYYM